MKSGPSAKQLAALSVALLVLLVLITHQAASATAVHNVLGWLRHGADSIINFIRNGIA